MIKKNKNQRQLFLKEVVEKQIDRLIFTKEKCGMLGWDTIKNQVEEEARYRCLIQVINLTTQKTYRSISEAEREEHYSFGYIQEACITGKKLYDDTRFAYLDYKGQPILNEGHSKDHYYPHKPSMFNIISYSTYKEYEVIREDLYRMRCAPYRFDKILIRGLKLSFKDSIKELFCSLVAFAIILAIILSLILFIKAFISK